MNTEFAPNGRPLGERLRGHPDNGSYRSCVGTPATAGMSSDNSSFSFRAIHFTAAHPPSPLRNLGDRMYSSETPVIPGCCLPPAT